MNIFIDNNLSPIPAGTLNGFLTSSGEGKAVHLRDMFNTSAKDIEWIQGLGKHELDWIIISGDRRITRNLAEREAWKEATLIGFFVSNSLRNMGQHIILHKIFYLFDEIRSVVARNSGTYKMLKFPDSGLRFRDLNS